MIRILIVEDDPMVIEITKSFIEKIPGYTISGQCRGGTSALEFLKKNNVDLIIADISMPNMDGLTFVMELRKEQNNSDIIFVTALNDPETIKTALKYGAVDYIVKPYDFNRFKKSMESYKDRFNTLNRKNSVEQNEIDRITNRDSINTTSELPKGIHSSTLKKVLKTFDDSDPDMELTIEYFSSILKMSVVSLRHYMDYLCSEGIIEYDTKYGTVGRPKYLYRRTNKLADNTYFK